MCCERGLGPPPAPFMGVFIPQAGLQAEPLHQQHAATRNSATVPADTHSGWQGRQAPWMPSPTSAAFAGAAPAGAMLARAAALPARPGPPSSPTGMLAPGSCIGAAWTTDDIVPPQAAYQLHQAPGSTPGSARSSFESQPPVVPFLSAPLVTVAGEAAYAHTSAAGMPCWRAVNSDRGSHAAATYAPPPPPPTLSTAGVPAWMPLMSVQQLLLADTAASKELCVIDGQVEQLLAQRALLQRSLCAGDPCVMRADVPGCRSVPSMGVAPATTQLQSLYASSSSVAAVPAVFMAAGQEPQQACTRRCISSDGADMAGSMAVAPLGGTISSLANGLTLEELVEAQQLRLALHSQLMHLLPPE